jgi:Mn2+/Fe2+ NRAMP family transporter
MPLSLAIVGLLLIGRYDEFVAVFRYVLIGFLAFGAAAILAQPDWFRVLKGSLAPTLSLRSPELTGTIALLGTTLTAYVYLWETVARGVEEPADHPPGSRRLAQARIGSVVGAVFTAVTLWFMLVAFAATLGQHHQTVSTAEGAAHALRPLAGPLDEDLFAAGLIASAVVALPVLMATTAHVVGAEFDWRRGLSERIGHAKRFYAVLAASILLGVAVVLIGVPLLGMLVAASVIGGLATPIGLVLLVRLARDHEVMGDQRISAWLAAGGWTVAAVVGGLGLLYVSGAALERF